jgi:hypothetical protein
MWQHYYSSLFTAQQRDTVGQDDMLAKITHKLSQGERDACEGLLTEQ